MTTYGEAYEMGLASNVAAATKAEAICAMGTLAQKALENSKDIPVELRETITHVLSHLKVISKLSDVASDYYEEKIDLFERENPGKIEALSEELGQSEIISQMQDVLGMTEEEKDQMRELKSEQTKAVAAEYADKGN